VRRALVSAAVAASTLVTAAPLNARSNARVDCHQRDLTFIFWPHGHPAIASVRFPSFPHPHVEVYKGSGRRYPNRDQIGLVVFDAGGTTGGGFSQSCSTVAGAATATATSTTAMTAAATALVCTFPVPAELEYAKTSRSITLRAVVPKTLRIAVSTRLAAGGSSLRFDPKLCRPTPPPH
jgi:hypothetical protein